MRDVFSKEIEKVQVEAKEYKLRLTREIQKVCAKIYQVKSSILKWLIGFLIIQTITIIGVIAGLFQVLRRFQNFSHT